LNFEYLGEFEFIFKTNVGYRSGGPAGYLRGKNIRDQTSHVSGSLLRLYLQIHKAKVDTLHQKLKAWWSDRSRTRGTTVHRLTRLSASHLNGLQNEQFSEQFALYSMQLFHKHFIKVLI
jgi:hypothetical protein